MQWLAHGLHNLEYTLKVWLTFFSYPASLSIYFKYRLMSECISWIKIILTWIFTNNKWLNIVIKVIFYFLTLRTNSNKWPKKVIFNVLQLNCNFERDTGRPERDTVEFNKPYVVQEPSVGQLYITTRPDVIQGVNNTGEK